MTNRLARSGRTRLKEKSRDRHPVVTSPDLQILVPMTGPAGGGGGALLLLSSPEVAVRTTFGILETDLG